MDALYVIVSFRDHVERLLMFQDSLDSHCIVNTAFSLNRIPVFSYVCSARMHDK